MSSVSFTLDIDADSPSLTVNSGTITADEGTTAINSGTYSDANAVQLDASLGTVADNGDGHLDLELPGG